MKELVAGSSLESSCWLSSSGLPSSQSGKISGLKGKIPVDENPFIIFSVKNLLETVEMKEINCNYS